MIKRLGVALAAFFAFVSIAQGAGTVPGFSLTPQFDLTGHLAIGCRLYIIQAGTVSTPQNAYSDSGLTLLLPNPLTCDASGRLPQWFVSDGNIKLRLTTSTGTQIFVGDQLLVIGASSGGGGGSPVDPTTILATGDMKIVYGTGILDGFVRANGRTIGSPTSGATERANSDVQALFEYLWGADANLTVSGGRGVSAAADWAANKTITLPDLRGRTIAGLDDMGNSAAGNLTSTYFGSTPTTLGATGFHQSQTLLTSNLPPYTPAGSIVTTSQGQTSPVFGLQSGTGGPVNIGGSGSGGTNVPLSLASAFTGTAQGGTSTAFAVGSPEILMTIYIKL